MHFLIGIEFTKIIIQFKQLKKTLFMISNFKLFFYLLNLIFVHYNYLFQYYKSGVQFISLNNYRTLKVK